MTVQLFDLNIETVLEHWKVEHAIRELIANAIDEQVITGTAAVDIERSGSSWLIRDHGRGLRIEHFTLNENPEKLAMPDRVIGKFGGGLKDALATFHRHAIEVTLRSPHGVFTIEAAEKHGFSEITTLHVAHESIAARSHGTEIEVRGISHEQMRAAQDLFVCFADERVIERTRYGDVLACASGAARIYVSGVLVNEEPEFLFSYNVTSITPAMRARLNRERTNVGRTTYAERVKSILLTARCDEVKERLADQVLQRAAGQQSAELGWVEVRDAAFRLYAQRNQVAFVTEEHLREHPEVIDDMRRDGIEPAVITEADEARISETGAPVRTFAGYVEEFNDSFEYTWVQPDDLNAQEAAVLAHADKILDLIALDERPPVLISSTMRIGGDSTLGVWDSELHAIVIERSQLQSLSSFARVLLHEAAHYTSGAPDVSRAFESELTEYLGRIAINALDDGAGEWVTALGRYADAHVALGNLVVALENDDLDDWYAGLRAGVSKSSECAAAFAGFQDLSPPTNIHIALKALIGERRDYVDRLESYIEDAKASEPASSEVAEGQAAMTVLRSEDGSPPWVDALSRYADAHVALRDLIVDVESGEVDSGEVDDVRSFYKQGIRAFAECNAAFAVWQDSGPPQNVRLTIAELIGADGTLIDRLESCIDSFRVREDLSCDPTPQVERRCGICGARNRIPASGNRLIRCGKCRSELGRSG